MVPENKWKPLYSKEQDFHAGKIESSLSRLVELLQEANRRADNWKDIIDTMKRRYDNLHKDYMALKYSDICISCQREQDSTPPGGTITLCRSCGEGKQTTESLKRELEKIREETRYWQDCYETALKQITDFPATKYDG